MPVGIFLTTYITLTYFPYIIALIGVHILTEDVILYQRFLKKARRRQTDRFSNESYVKAIMKAGQVWILSGLTFIATEALVFHLYGRKYQRDLLRI